MLFLAVVKDFVRFAKVKIQSKRGMVYCQSGYHTNIYSKASSFDRQMQIN